MYQEAKIFTCTFLSCLIAFNFTQKTFFLINRVELLENNLNNLKERLNDLELFKLKVYNNEIVPGRRAWDEFDVDMEFEEEID